MKHSAYKVAPCFFFTMNAQQSITVQTVRFKPQFSVPVHPCNGQGLSFITEVFLVLCTESKAVRELFEALKNAPPRYIPLEGPHFHITDYSTMFSTAPKQPYYDFQIHPEWHQPWHKKYETIKAWRRPPKRDGRPMASAVSFVEDAPSPALWFPCDFMFCSLFVIP